MRDARCQICKDCKAAYCYECANDVFELAAELRESALTHAEKTQNRYVRLGNAIAELTKEAAALEEEMSVGKYYPMSIQVYDGLRTAHEGVLRVLYTLTDITGHDIKVKKHDE